MTDHRAPLAPGEIRTHTVGLRTFTVMHVAGGSFTQASCRTGIDGPSRVLLTSMDDRSAVEAYADAIEQAESDAIDELDEADGSMFISSSTGELIDPQAGPAPDADLSFNLPMGANMQLVTGERPTAPSLTDDIAALRLGIKSLYPERRHTADVLLAVLDRIATQVPVRSMFKGREVSQHACGAVKYGDGFPDGCSWCYKHGRWQPLYTLGGE